MRAIAATSKRSLSTRRKGMRYVTLSNFYTASAEATAMVRYRQGVVKLLNSLSRNSRRAEDAHDRIRKKPSSPSISTISIGQRTTGTGHIGLVLMNGDATKDRVAASWQELLGKAKGGDNIVFSYEGHGSQEPEPAGRHDEADGLNENSAGRLSIA